MKGLHEILLAPARVTTVIFLFWLQRFVFFALFVYSGSPIFQLRETNGTEQRRARQGKVHGQKKGARSPWWGASSSPSVNRSFAGTEACKQKREEKKHKICVKRQIISHENKSECSSCNNWGKSLTRYLAESAMSWSIGPFIMIWTLLWSHRCG